MISLICSLKNFRSSLPELQLTYCLQVRPAEARAYRMRKFPLHFAALLILSALSQPLHAAEAALFNNGTSAILRPWNQDNGPLLDIDLKTGAVTQLDSAALGLPEAFSPQGCSKSDFVLGTAGTRL